MSFAWAGVCMVMCLWTLAVSPASSSTPKLIEFGWDEPSTAYMREHVAEMETMPFDGVVFNVHYQDAQGKDSVLEWTGFGAMAIPWEALQPALDDLHTTHFRRFTDNFVRFNVTPGNVDWFDDFSAIVNNARMTARLVRRAKLKGILFDVEQYNDKLFDPAKQPGRDRHTVEEYVEQVRRRGAEVMTAFQREAPGLAVFLTYGYVLAGTRRDDQLRHDYGLLPAFLDGMFAAARGRTMIVDGWENSYGFRRPIQFETSYRQIHVGNRALCGVPDAYAKRVQAGFGLWMDLDWRRKGWDVDAVSKNAFTPQALETSLALALKRTDRYVWLYTEQPRWWPREKLPDAYVEAVRQARTAADMSNP